MSSGTVYWITGLSGAGKTTIGTLFYEYLKTKKDNVLLIDGDVLREILGNRDYSPNGRDEVTGINRRLMKMLTRQGIDVVCCVIGMYDRYREENRKNFENYYEIYLKVSIEELIRRDSKGLYKKALAGEIQNVYGIDLAYEEPKNPDLIINNEGNVSAKSALKLMIDFFNV